MERRCLGPTSEDLSMLFRLPFHLDDRFSVGCRQLAAAFAAEFNQSIDIGRAPDSGSVDLDTVTSVEQLESIREKLIAWRLRPCWSAFGWPNGVSKYSQSWMV